MQRIYAISILLCFFLSDSNAQDTAQVYLFGGDYYEDVKGLIRLQNDNFAFIGTSGSDYLNNTSYYVVVTDQNYNCIWNLILGEGGVDVGTGICEAPNGDIVVTGFGSPENQTGYDIKVCRIGADGSLVWTKTFGGVDWDFSEKIIPHPAGGYLVCGMTYSSGNGGSDGYILHIDENGNALSEWTYGNFGDDDFTDIDIAQDGIIISGSSQETASDLERAWVMKIDFEGVIQWQKLDIIPSSVSGYTSAQVYGNLLFSCGNYLSDEGHLQGFMMCRYIDSAEIFWMNQEVHPGDYVFNDFLLTENNIFILGYTNAYGNGSDNGAITVNDFYGAWQNGITVGAQYLSFTTGVIANDHLVVGLKARNYEFSPLFQAGVYTYPNLQPQSNSETEWQNVGCFTISIDDEVDKGDFAFVRYFDLTGRAISDLIPRDETTKVSIPNALTVAVYFNEEFELIYIRKIFSIDP